MDPDTRHRLATAVRRWALDLEGLPLESASGVVAFGARAATPVVLKLAAPASDETRAATALQHFDGHGSVRLLAQAPGALLLERAVPGTPLVQWVAAGRDDEATLVVCETVAALHVARAARGDCPTVEAWGEGFARYRQSGDRRLPAALVERAAHVFTELAASQGECRLLHGDLHHYNILLDARRGWLAIDPKGLRGESAYELGAALRNPAWYATPTRTDRRVRLMTERLGLDRERVLGWAFAQAVLAAIWAWEDGLDLGFALAAIEGVTVAR